ncbi:MAG TPA: hypothetical protein VKE96_04630 [Vicinamibacterales bacterium]|nr:hypothetical protein [Vicinamibacterales bacterium]
MQWLMVSMISLAMTLGGLAARLEGDTKAAQLLAQARAALGGEKNLANVRGLTCTGSYERTLGDRQLSGEVTLDLQLPDKMLRTETVNPIGDMTIVVAQGINGEKLLRSQQTLNGPPGAIIRMAPPAANADAETQALRNARAEMARTLLAFLLATPASQPVEFAYGGEAEADEGKAEVLDAKGEGSFAVRLFVDQKTHRPLMLQYRGVAPQVRIQTQQMQGPPDPERLRRAEQAAHDAAGTAPPPQLVDIALYLDDYKSVDGVMLPHHIARSIDGKPVEEMTFKTIKVNPAFKSGAFEVR